MSETLKTVGQLKTEVRSAIWVSGEPENLISAHNDQFQEAFADIAKWVEGERADNVSVVRFCKTNYKMGMTVLPMVPGIITRIFTIANENYDDPVFYRNRPWPDPEGWARNLYLFPTPLAGTKTKWPLGFQDADVSNDSLYGRARTGIWAQYQRNIFIAPWIQSNECVVIEWRGIKTLWDDLDLINPSIHYKKAVKLYVQFAHERDYGDAIRAREFHEQQFTGHYDSALADLIHEDEEQRKVRNLVLGGYERNRLCSELADDWPAVVSDTSIVADLGNTSLPGANLTAVAALVHGWTPVLFLDAGLIAGGVTDYALTIGANFQAAVDGKIFLPAPSPADWDKDSLDSFLTYFSIPERKTFYDRCIGNLHLFFLDGDAREAGGITASGTQGQWLRARLATSTARWKVVKLFNAPYGSVHQTSDLQWPFKSWGADLVLCSEARNYERLNVLGLPVINNGLGGQTPIESVTSQLTVKNDTTYTQSVAVDSGAQVDILAGQSATFSRGASIVSVYSTGDIETGPHIIGPATIPPGTSQITIELNGFQMGSVQSLVAYTGGYGAGRITASPSTLLYEFMGTAGNVIDSLLLAK